MRPTAVLSHGLDSSPDSRKNQLLAPVATAAGLEVIRPDYRGSDDPAVRRDELLAVLSDLDGPVILVGSSMGAAISIIASQQRPVLAMFLMAPAVFMPGYEAIPYHPQAEHIEVVHGWRDETVPAANAIRWAREHRSRLTLVDDVHNLEGSLELLSDLFATFLRNLESVAPQLSAEARGFSARSIKNW